MSSPDYAAIRKEYALQSLDVKDVSMHPMTQFKQWFEQAMAANVMEVNAMSLATVDNSGQPSNRIVLLKDVTDEGFVFYTNYQSAKGTEIASNPKVALTFFWAELERQVRITGLASKVTSAASDSYFYSRPVSSQLGAIASAQSQVIKNRDVLEQQMSAAETEAHDATPQRPSHWGGYIVKPTMIEFWQGRKNRLHDRLAYTSVDGSAENWKLDRLSP